jgi:hypothetical protein
LARFSTIDVIVVVLAGICLGQSSNRVDVFGGFSYVSQDFSLTKPNGLIGWNASATVPLARRLEFVADFAGYYPN